MWVIIIIVVLGVFLFKIFDRDFIRATQQNDGNYLVEFESGKSPLCKLIDIFEYNEKDYYVFIPISSLRAIPSEDILVLKCIRKTENKIILVFPEQEADKVVLEKFLNKYIDKYNFVA